MWQDGRVRRLSSQFGRDLEQIMVQRLGRFVEAGLQGQRLDCQC